MGALRKAFGRLKRVRLRLDRLLVLASAGLEGFAVWNFGDIWHQSAVAILGGRFGPHGVEAAIGALLESFQAELAIGMVLDWLLRRLVTSAGAAEHVDALGDLNKRMVGGAWRGLGSPVHFWHTCNERCTVAETPAGI